MTLSLLTNLLGGHSAGHNYPSTPSQPQTQPCKTSVDQFQKVFSAGVAQGFALASSSNQCGSPNVPTCPGQSNGTSSHYPAIDGLLGGLTGGHSHSHSQSSSQGGLGGLLDAKTNLLSGLFGGGSGHSNGGIIGSLLGSITGGSSHSSSGALGGLGGLVGGAAQSVHGLAEHVIDATGIGPLFAPIDDAIIHPILWDPISVLTGVDVSKHPEGIPDVSDPLGVRSYGQ